MYSGQRPRRPGLALAALLTAAFGGVLTAGPGPGTATKGPLSPREELATFRLPRGFRVELVASEPNVIDPVAIAFDEDGRLFVAEMRGYPNGGVGTGQIATGRKQIGKNWRPVLQNLSDAFISVASSLEPGRICMIMSFSQIGSPRPKLMLDACAAL